MRDFREATQFTSRNINVVHTYYSYSEQNIYFCNIPKCGSTSIDTYIQDNPDLRFNRPFNFTVIRNPIERFKHGLWFVTRITRHYSKWNRVDKDNRASDEINVRAFVNALGNAVGESDTGLGGGASRTAVKPLFRHILMHVAPQIEYIINRPSRWPGRLKVFTVDQMDDIFGVEIPKLNMTEPNQAYEEFSENFDKDYPRYKRFIERYYYRDITMWNNAVAGR